VEGQLSDLPRKSVEPIALKSGTPVRTLQEFLSQHCWKHDQMRDRVQQLVVRDCSGPNSVGLIDETSYVKKGRRLRAYSDNTVVPSASRRTVS